MANDRRTTHEEQVKENGRVEYPLHESYKSVDDDVGDAADGSSRAYCDDPGYPRSTLSLTEGWLELIRHSRAIDFNLIELNKLNCLGINARSNRMELQLSIPAGCEAVETAKRSCKNLAELQGGISFIEIESFLIGESCQLPSSVFFSFINNNEFLWSSFHAIIAASGSSPLSAVENYLRSARAEFT